MTRDIPTTRTIGIPAPKPAAKAILGFVLLEDGTEVVVEEVVVLGIEGTTFGVAVEVVATSMVVYRERWIE